MANHVSPYISFENLSDTAVSFLDGLFPNYDTPVYEVLGKIYDKTEKEMDEWVDQEYKYFTEGYEEYLEEMKNE